MPVLDIRNVCLSYGERDVLDNVSFQVSEGCKMALVGENGAGKTTIFRIIAGVEKPDSGEVILSRGSRVSYLPQSGGLVLSDRTMIEELTDGIPADSGEKYERLRQIHRFSSGLGFTDADMKRKCGEFSPGWQMRVALCKTITSGADFLLLDEPTNYLDIEARLFLAATLRKMKCGFVIVSHDRFFIDRVCAKTCELKAGSVTVFSGGWSDYEREKARMAEYLLKERERSEREKKELVDFIERFRYKATKAKQVQDRVKRLERMEEVEVAAKSRGIDFAFPQIPRSPNDVLCLEDVCRSYDGKTNIIDNLSFSVFKGEKLAVIGRNGMGKSTLLRLVTGEDAPTSGKVRVPHGVVMSSYSQDAGSELDPEKTVFEELRSVARGLSEEQLLNSLGSFLFRGNDVKKSVSVLSGGEKSRLAVLKLLMSGSNFLVMDEATNHLDIPSKEALLKALSKYTGTLVFVSHDVDFIRKLATKVLYLDGSGSHMFDGDFDYFLYRVSSDPSFGSSVLYADLEGSGIPSADSLKVSDRRNAIVMSSGEKECCHESDGPASDYELAKMKRNAGKAAERRIGALEAEMARLDALIKECEGKLNLEEIYSDRVKSNEVTAEIEACRKKLAAVEEEWLEVNS